MMDEAFFKDWDDVVEKLSMSVGEIEKGEMTVKMFHIRYGVNRVTACQKLRNLWSDGLASRRWVYEDGKKVYAYKISKKMPDLRGSDTSREVLPRAQKGRRAQA